jgi:MFS family permease
MRPAELHPAKRSARQPGQFREGLATIVGRRELLLPIVLVGVVGTFGLNFPVTLALMASQTFAGTAATYGAFTSSVAVGSLVGAVLATRRRRITFRLLVAAATAFGTAEALAGLMPTRLLFMALLVPTGAAVLTFTTAANATVQLAAGEQMRGRVMSFYILVFLGTTPLGAPLIGLLSQHFGARSGLVVGGLLCAGSALLVGLLLRREVTRGEEPGQVSNQPPTSNEAPATSSTLVAASRSPRPAASFARRSGSSIVATATASADGPSTASGDDAATTPRAS